LGRQIIGIDHLIVGVRDLEAARARYARLGFNSTPRGRHRGWGTANYCIMFERDYLELLGIVDPARFTNNLDRFLEQREGLLGVVVGSRDAEATRAAWAEAGVEPGEVRDLGRVLEGEEGEVELRFKNVMPGDTATGGLNLFACQHLTPEPMRRPAWLIHPNGAKTIRSCTVATIDTGPLVEAMTRLFGSSTVTDTDNVVAVHTGQGVLVIAPPEDAELMHPLVDAAEVGETPMLVALTLTVTDPERTAAFLKLQGVPFRQALTGEVLVPPAEAHGVALEFTAD
jgi:hypothetical protein